MLTTPDLILTEQFVGPPELGNGGYVVGALAEALVRGNVVGAGAVEVTLRTPLPIDVRLQFVETDEGAITLVKDNDVLAVAKHASLELDVPGPVSVADAISAQPQSPSLKPGFHPTLGERLGVHPVCFCCGAEREEADGLRVFPAATDGECDVTAIWRPHEAFARADGTIGPEIIGAAIDCPGAFAFLVDNKRAGLLGRMTVEFLKPLKAGEETRITGWQLGEDGRKMMAGTAIFDSEGDLVAMAKQTWFGFPSSG